MGRGLARSLGPGFRFHPTDEELVGYYLKRKVSGKAVPLDAISEIDIYKFEPWDLPGKSKLKSRDLEWYFFCALDKKYGNGSRTNRATERGYWKTTGKDRLVRYNARIFATKKTLVYHVGRAPRGERTNWVMHEYKLTDDALPESQDSFVLCRVFEKSGTGPKNGEQYGAPFIEEEWENEEEEEEEEDDEELFFGSLDFAVTPEELDLVNEADPLKDRSLLLSLPSKTQFFIGETSGAVNPEDNSDDDLFENNPFSLKPGTDPTELENPAFPDQNFFIGSMKHAFLEPGSDPENLRAHPFSYLHDNGVAPDHDASNPVNYICESGPTSDGGEGPCFDVDDVLQYMDLHQEEPCSLNPDGPEKGEAGGKSGAGEKCSARKCADVALTGGAVLLSAKASSAAVAGSSGTAVTAGLVVVVVTVDIVGSGSTVGWLVRSSLKKAKGIDVILSPPLLSSHCESRSPADPSGWWWYCMMLWVFSLSMSLCKVTTCG